MKYQTIVTLKKSEKATVELAAVERFAGPVIVKQLKGGNPEIYRLLSERRDPHIPQMYAVEEQEDALLIVEEYVDGESLSEHLQKNLLSDEQKLNYALQLCEVVGFLHTLNPSVIHRDIKPSNILINGKGELKLIDFDASRYYKEALSSSDTRLLGTVEYAPPEQFGYSQTDVRSDIYSMGVVFHEMRPTENRKLTEQWEKIAEKCTSFDPKNRYQSVAKLAQEIKKLQMQNKQYRKKRIPWLCVGAILLCCSIALTIGIWSKLENEASNGTLLTGTPTPVTTSTPIPIATNKPEPTAMNTPAPTATNKPAPTATNTPVPTATNTPVPTATNTPALTATNTPAPTATNTPAPTVTPRPTPTPILIEIAHHYYKALAKDTELLMYYDGDAPLQNGTLKLASCYSFATGALVEIPAEYVELGMEYTRIADEFLSGLEPGQYRFRIEFVYDNGKRSGSCNQNVEIHSEKEFSVQNRTVVIRTEQGIYTDYFRDLTGIIRSDQLCRIKGVSWNLEGQPVQRMNSDWYEIRHDGKAVVIKKEYLLEYLAEGKINILYQLDNGNEQLVKVNLYEGLPEGVSLLDFGIIPTPTPRPTAAPFPERLGYSYYQAYGNDFILPDGKFRNIDVLDYVTCYCMATGISVDIPAEMVEQLGGCLRVRDDFMMSLEPGLYQFTFYYNGAYEGNSVFEKLVKIHSKEEIYGQTEAKLLKHEATIYRQYGDFIINVIRDGETSRIVDMYFLNRDLERTDIGMEWAGFSFVGQAFSIAAEHFMRFSEQGPLQLCIVFDDGSEEQMQINFEEGMPAIPQYFAGLSGVIRGVVPYYKAVSTDPGLVFNSNMEVIQIQSAKCYNRISGEIMDIPLYMLEAGMGYIGVSEEYMRLLPPALYQFEFEVNGANKLKWHVQIYQEAIIPNLTNKSSIQYWDQSLYLDMPGIRAVMSNGTNRKFTGVSFLKGLFETRVEPEWYSIACNGRYIFVDREFILKNCENERLTLRYWFDDGCYQNMDVQVKDCYSYENANKVEEK